MKSFAFVWRASAEAELLALYRWIAERADPDIAFDYTSRIEAFAEGLATFPERATPRHDLFPGLRTIVYRRRTVIAYRVAEESVEILRLLHRGQQWVDDADKDAT